MQIPVNALFSLLERYNGMDTAPVTAEAPVAPPPLQSDDPKIRAAAEELAAQSGTSTPCASQAA